MIPKIIHYCWFGGNPHNDIIKKCILSWNKFLPEYKIIEWNEDNVDIHSNDFLDFCYRNKQWAYVADYARLLALRDYGGIYLDTDMEVIKEFPKRFLHYDFFAGQEVNDTVSCGIIGVEKRNFIIEELLDYYDRTFLLEPIPVYLNELLTKHNLLDIDNYYLPKPEVFYPMDYSGNIMNLDKSYTIHHWEGSWKSDKKWFYDKYLESKASFMDKNDISFLKKLQHCSSPSYENLKKFEKILNLVEIRYGKNTHEYNNVLGKYNRLIKLYINKTFIHPVQFKPYLLKELFNNQYLKEYSLIFYFRIFLKSIIFKKT